ncbi:hypothetical protein MOSE0_G01970 [Monosporozyma servazzii]
MFKCIKEDDLIDGKWLWQEDQNEQTLDIFNVPKKTYLTFGIFILDAFIRDVDPILQSCYDKLTKHLEDWNKFYPWSEYNGVSLRLDSLEGRKYILGQHCVEDNLEQEGSLVVALLRLFSKEMGEQVYIKVADTDGDFLLASCHETIPGNYEYPVGNNRLWLQNGKFIIIPDTIHPNRGVFPKECIDILLNSPFKCVQLENISKKLDILYPIEEFPSKYLSKLGLLTLELPDNDVSSIIRADPKILNFLIKSLFSSGMDSTDIVENVNSTNLISETESQQFLVSKNHFDLLLLYLQINNLKDDISQVPKYSGKLLTNCLATLLDSKTFELVESNADILNIPTWKSSSVFKLHNFSDLDYSQDYEPEKREEPNDKLMDLFTQFFNENEKDSTNKTSSNSKQTNISEDDDSDDEDERKATEYLANENSGINEDDFFEFFLKEALNLKDSDMEELRRDVSKQKISKIADSRNGQNSSDDDIDEFDEMLGDLRSKEDVSKAFEDMFGSLNIDGAPNGPFESLLRNLANNSNNSI